MRFWIFNEVFDEVLDSHEVFVQDLIEILILDQSHWDSQRKKIRKG